MYLGVWVFGFLVGEFWALGVAISGVDVLQILCLGGILGSIGIFCGL